MRDGNARQKKFHRRDFLKAGALVGASCVLSKWLSGGGAAPPGSLAQADTRTQAIYLPYILKQPASTPTATPTSTPTSTPSPGQCSFVTDYQPRTIPSLPEPDYLQSYVDPVFGQRVTRVTGKLGSPVPNVSGGTWGTVARHMYSKEPAWNADGSLLWLKKNLGGSPRGDVFLGGNTYEPLFAKRCPRGSYALWHPADPDLVIWQSGSEVGTWNVLTDEVIVKGSFPGYSIQTKGEWNPTLDGQLIVVVAETSGRDLAFAYNLETGEKYPDIDLNNVGYIDWVSISLLGNFVVLNGGISGGDQTQVYDLYGNTIGPLWSTYGRPSHYDLTVDENRDEVAVGQSKTEGGVVIKRRLRDGQVTYLSPVGTPVRAAAHTSMRNYLRPGWAVTSHQRRLALTGTLYEDEIAMVKLDGSEIRRLVHMHDIYSDYDSEAQASVSPDGTKVIWASNWDNPGGPVAAYVVEFCQEENP